MDEAKLLEALRQASLAEIGGIFQEYARNVVHDAFVRLMFSEVKQLCGTFYHPGEEDCFERAGSAKGYLRIDGRKVPVTRPRVRDRVGKREKPLATYSAGKDDGGAIKDMIFRALSAGLN